MLVVLFVICVTFVKHYRSLRFVCVVAGFAGVVSFLFEFVGFVLLGCGSVVYTCLAGCFDSGLFGGICWCFVCLR